MPLHVSSTCAHRQEVKIVLYSLWYHHTYRRPSGAQVERGLDSIQCLYKLRVLENRAAMKIFERKRNEVTEECRRLYNEELMIGISHPLLFRC